jgi:hypothetical protein
VNDSDTEELKLYTLYSPPEHRDVTVRPTKADAMMREEHFDGTTTEYLSATNISRSAKHDVWAELKLPETLSIKSELVAGGRFQPPRFDGLLTNLPSFVGFRYW